MTARRAVAAARLTQFRSSRLVKSNGPPPSPCARARVYIYMYVCASVYAANALSVLSADPARLRVTRGLSGASWPGRGLNYSGRSVGAECNPGVVREHGCKRVNFLGDLTSRVHPLRAASSEVCDATRSHENPTLRCVMVPRSPGGTTSKNSVASASPFLMSLR